MEHRPQLALINPFDVMKKTEELYRLLPGSISGRRKTSTLAEARAVAMYFVRAVTDYSYLEIAEHFDKDHSTIVHNCKKIEKIVQEGSNSRVDQAILLLEHEFGVFTYEERDTCSLL